MMSKRPLASGNAAEMTLLPFLDIIFASIGIFLLIFALRSLVVAEAPRQLEAHHVILCDNAAEIRHYPGADAAPMALRRHELAATLEAIARAEGPAANLVFAFTAICENVYRDLQRDYRAAMTIAGEQETNMRAIRMQLWPLASDDGADAAFLARWRGEVMP